MLFHIVEKKKRSRPMSPKAQLEQEKRMRREIANSNERRRMQCINAGFQGLRALMPQLSGEKLSKAAILQHTKEYIAKKEQELKQAKSQNEQLKRMLMEVNRDRDVADRQNETPPPKRKKRDTECSDEGIGMCEPGSEGGATTTTTLGSPTVTGTKEVVGGSISSVDELHRELVDLRQQLDRERVLRMCMEERARALEAQLVHTSHPQPSHRISPPLLSSPPHHHHHHHTSAAASLPSPINLKVESPLNRPTCNNNNNNSSSSNNGVQEISAHEDRVPHLVQLTYDPKPHQNLENLVEAIRQIEGDRVLGGGDDCGLDGRYVSSSSSSSSSPPGGVGDSGSSSSSLSKHQHHHQQHHHPHHPSHHHSTSTLNCSEESEKESSVSDPEEECSKSEGSGRDSPSPLGLGLCARSLAMCVSGAPITPAGAVAGGGAAAPPQAAHQGILSEKYPIASHLLHRPPYFRPGVIVHKS